MDETNRHFGETKGTYAETMTGTAETEMAKTETTQRAHYLGQLSWYNLNIACETVFRAFESMPFLVGSALSRPDFRDVDIRVILRDDEFAKQFPHQPADPRGKMNDPGWEFICSAISEWLRARTGLPIDFQIQQMTAANDTFKGQKRNACGMFISRRDLKEAGRL